MRNYLLVGAAAVAAWFFLRKSSFAQRTRILFRKFRIVGSGLAKKFELNFSVQNPTNQTATISALTGEVIINDKIVANFSSFSDQKIASKSESNLQVIATPTGGILQLLSQKGWLTGGAFYTIQGTANVDGVIVPINYSAKLI